MDPAPSRRWTNMTNKPAAASLVAIVALAATALGGGLPVLPGGRPGGPADIGLSLRADLIETDKATGITYLIGHVRLARGRAEVSADAAIVWFATREAYLEGNVVYRVGKTHMRAERGYVHWTVSTDMETGKTTTNLDRGLFFQSDIRWHTKPEEIAWRIKADEIVQPDIGRFIARGHAFITPNPFHRPHTYFRASKIELVADEKLTVSNITYNVLGVGLPDKLQGWWVPPTFWPRLYIPLGWEWPEMRVDFGTARRFGTFVLSEVVYDLPTGSIPFVDSKVGIQFDHYSERGNAYGASLRYKYEDNLAGRLDAYRVPDDSGEDFNKYELGTTDRYRLRFFHSQDDIPKGWEFDVELQKHSDSGFLQEFFREEYDEDKPIENRAYLKYTTGPLAAYLHTRWQVNEWLDTTEYLPQAGVNVFSYPVWGDLLYTGHIEVANIRRRLGDVRLPYGTILTAPSGTTIDDDDDDDDLFDYEENLDEYENLSDRDDLEEVLARKAMVSKLLKRNYFYFPHRNTLQEELSDNRDFWRFDTYHQLSYPFSLGIFRIEPFAGGRFTWYEETLTSGSDDWRSLFAVGFRAATQFHKTWQDVRTDTLRVLGAKLMPLDINGLRHVITPELRVMSITKPSTEVEDLILTDDTDVLQPIADPHYRYRRRRYRPSDSTGLAFGDVDAIYGVSTVSLGLRNRWQTRRETIKITTDEEREKMPELPDVRRYEFIADVVDIDAEVNFHSFRRDVDSSLEDLDQFLVGIKPPDALDFGDGYTDFRLDTRFRPVNGVEVFNDMEWVLSSDGSADTGVEVVNTGLNIATSERWEMTLMQRYESGEDTRYGARLAFVPTAKWRLAFQYVYSTESSDPIDISAHITRDFHDWIAEFAIEDDRELGFQTIALRLRPKFKRELVQGLYFSRELGAGAFGDGSEEYVQYDY